VGKVKIYVGDLHHAKSGIWVSFYSRFRVKAQSTYSIKDVSGDLDSAFKMSMGVQSEDSQMMIDAMQVSDEKQIDETTDNSNAEALVPTCPKCGGELIERVATKDQFAGQKFWGFNKLDR
jgi:hypothetical protein